MAFKNRVRLPFHLTRPQFPDERNVFRMANGVAKVQSIIIRKTYEGETGYLPEWAHQRLKIALSHDEVNIESQRFLGGVAVDGEYDIEWPEFMDYPFAKAKFKVQVTPFNATNANCKSCEEASQLDLVDDNLPDALDQSQTYEFNVFGNDTINCFPITAEVTFFNPLIVSACSIDAAGNVTLTTKSLFWPRNGTLLAVYKVTCPNGGYDEARIYGNVNGDQEACVNPANVRLLARDEDSAEVAWDAPSTPPAEGYEWKLTLEASPAAILEEGVTSATTLELPVDLPALEPATDYLFSVRSKCSTDDYSDWTDLNFTTTGLDSVCGRYKIEIFDGYAFRDVTYLACNGSYATIRLLPYKPRYIWAQHNSPGDPVSIVGADSITYAGPS
jgi:hypothetical protein